MKKKHVKESCMETEVMNAGKGVGSTVFSKLMMFLASC